MDSIWNCAFGLDCDMQNDTNNLFMEKSFEHMKDTVKFSILRLLSCKYNLVFYL